MREIPELSTFFRGKAPEEVKTEEDARKWSVNLLREFYESMPNCPRCDQKCFRSFRNRGAIGIEDFNCKKCGADLNKNPKTLGISYSKYSIMDAWWYEVVDDEKENSSSQLEP